MSRPFAVLAAALVVIAACAARPPERRDPPRRPSAVPARRYGPDRALISYAEREPEAKAKLFGKINEERARAGIPRLSYDLVGAKAGDDFCLDAATTHAVGHWDMKGRPPYLRWAEAGGVDYHAQNFGSYTRIGAPVTESIASLLLKTHAGMMAERPPDDGHRRTVLDPIFTHVGIGVALVDGEFRMTEEFSRHVMEWIEIPSAPVPAKGTARFRARLPKGLFVGIIEISYEAPPTSLTLREISRRTSYGYPRSIHQLTPRLGAGMRWSGGDAGDFTVDSRGEIDLAVPLDHGKGSYYVLAYVGTGENRGQRLQPGTAARIEAE